MKVYKITNTENNLVYIGQTKGKLIARLKKHINSSKNLRKTNKFHSAIRLLGADKFHIELLSVCKNQEDLDIMETFYIDLYDSIENGYNDQLGGINGALTDNVKSKLSNIRKGYLNPFAGKKHTEEVILTLIEKRKGRKPNLKFNEDILQLIKEDWEAGMTHTKIKDKFGMSIGRVSQISRERNWVKHIF